MGVLIACEFDVTTLATFLRHVCNQMLVSFPFSAAKELLICKIQEIYPS